MTLPASRSPMWRPGVTVSRGRSWVTEPRMKSSRRKSTESTRILPSRGCPTCYCNLRFLFLYAHVFHFVPPRRICGVFGYFHNSFSGTILSIFSARAHSGTRSISFISILSIHRIYSLKSISLSLCLAIRISQSSRRSSCYYSF